MSRLLHSKDLGEVDGREGGADETTPLSPERPTRPIGQHNTPSRPDSEPGISPRAEPKTPLLSPDGKQELRQRRRDSPPDGKGKARAFPIGQDNNNNNNNDSDNGNTNNNNNNNNNDDDDDDEKDKGHSPRSPGRPPPGKGAAAANVFAAAASLLTDTAKASSATAAAGGTAQDGFATPNVRRQRRQSVGTALRGHIRRTLRAVQVKQASLMRKATEVVFPEAKQLPRQRPRITGAEVESGLTLQILLYFNSFFSPMWFIMHILLGSFKRANLEIPLAFAVMDPLVLVLWIIDEPARLMFAWTGNLEEKVPQLGTWYLLTAFPTFPCNLYFLFVQPNRMPLDMALNYVNTALTLLELIVGFVAIKRLIRSQTTRFYLAELGEPTDPISAEGGGSHIDNTITQPLPPIPRA